MLPGGTVIGESSYQVWDSSKVEPTVWECSHVCSYYTPISTFVEAVTVATKKSASAENPILVVIEAPKVSV
jgi:hypothetical protein